MATDDEDILGIYPASEINKQHSTKRRWDRVKIDATIKVTMLTHGKIELVHGQANDVSEGGMAAYISADLKVDDEIQIEIMLPYGKKPINFSARVRNRNSFRYGLEFVEVEPYSRAELLNSLKGLAAAR